MQANWSDLRLKGDDSLGFAFLRGIRSRRDADSPFLSALIRQVDQVVSKQLDLQLEIDAVCELFQKCLVLEFVTGNPFDTWKKV